MPSVISEKEDMTDFPRGGGSGLTNLEIREIKHEVEAELEVMHICNTKSSPVKKKKRSSSQAKGTKKLKTDDEVKVHVELLSFKKLSVGMSLVGAVKEINELDIVVSLPNQLTGFVSITEISDLITQQVSLVAKADDDDDDEELPDLNDYFSIGMPVVVCITRLEDANQKDQSKRRIELSMRPEIINACLSAKDVTKGMSICANVKSEEDHGYVLSLGIKGLSGFMVKDSSKDLKPGSWIFVNVVECNEAMNVVKCEFPKDFKKCLISNSHSMEIESFKAGMAVNATVKSVTENGLVMSFMGYFIGTVDFLHLHNLDLDSVEVGKKFSARIIYTDLDKKKFGLSLNPFMVSWSESGLLSVQNLEVGLIVDRAKVKSIEKHGLILELPGLGKGFVHVSNLSDSKVEKVDKNFKIGSTHKARIISLDYLDDLILVTFQSSVIEQPIMTYDDIKVGSIIKGKIIKVDTFGVIVGITNSIKGLCPTQHLSDAKISNPDKLFKVNSSIKFQVLSVDTKNKKVMLTHRKSFMSSRFPWITSYQDVNPGMFSIGIITSVQSFGCIVHFYDNVHALIPISELSDEYVKTPSDLFSVGQVMKCRILSVDAANEKMRASFKLRSKSGNPSISIEVMEKIEVGTITNGTVTAILLDGLMINIPSFNIEGFLPKTQMSDNLTHVDKLFSLVTEGDEFSELLILSKDARRGQLLLSLKPWMIHSAKSGAVKNVQELKAGMVLPGFVKNVTETACFISLVGDFTAMSTLHNISDMFVSNASDNFVNGQSVIAHISKVDYDQMKIYVNLKESILLGSSKLKEFEHIRLKAFMEEREKIRKSAIKTKDLNECLSWSNNFPVSGYAEGSVKSIMPYGTILDMKLGGSGLITNYTKTSYKQGDVISGQILDVDISKKIVDLGLINRGKVEIPNQDKKSVSKIKTVIESGEPVDASILVIKEEIAVISISGAKNIIGYCLSKGVNTKTSSFKRFKVGQQFKCLVLSFENGLCLAAPSKGKNVAENHLDLRRTVKQSLDPEIRSIEDYKLGKLTMGRIQSIKQTQINVTLGSNMKGRIHISEIVDSVSSISENIFDKFKVGQQIQAKVIGFNDAKSHKFLPFSHRNPVSQTVVELTIRPSELELMDCCLVESYDERRPTLENIKAKVEYTGFVHQVDEKYVWIHVGPKLLGRVSIFNLSLDPDVLSNVTEHFHIGSVVKCFLLSKDESKNLLDLTLISDADPLVSKDSLKIGQLLVGKVVKIQNGLMIQISPNIFAKAHITDLADEYVADILKMHTVGDYERCKVVALNEDRTQIDVSLRPSVLNEITDVQDPEITELKDLKDDSIIKGYVKNVASNGVFVSIGRNIAARVKIKDLSDSYIKDWKNLYKVGQLVKGKILSINQDNQWIDMSLKSSVVDPCSQPALKFEDLEEGMKVDGLIKAIHSYGAFIQLNGSDVSGLCHISEMSDVAVTQIDKLYEVGDPVKAIILKVDSGKRKLSLGLKASYFDDMDIEEPEQLEEDHASSVNDASDDGSDSDESDIVMQDRDAEKTEDSDLSSDDGLSDDEPLALTGFSWNETMESNEPEQKPEQVVEEPIRKSKRAKKRAKKEAEEAIARKELSLLHDESPQSADDFERLLLANPSSSYMWIKYMAFYIQMTEIENARKVAERALSTINFRDEQEKLNIWVAYLNLENSFGDSETLSQVFERATNYNDPKKAYIHLATIYDKTNKNDECDKLYKIMIKKFKTSSKVWINYSHFLAKQNMFDQIHNILNSSLKSLPKHKHVKIILSFSLLEFKKGTPERGRTLFEGLLSNYPKRVDIWSVYLDQEIRLGDLVIVRRLFERAIKLDRSTKKMKFLFKKYLLFENEYGTEETQNHVKDEAMKYVERVSGESLE